MSQQLLSKKRIAKNTFYLYIRMILVLLVSLYTSRVILNVLGVDDFGAYNVIAGFVSLFAFLHTSFSSSLQRYYNYEWARSGAIGFKNVFCAGIFIQILFIICMVSLFETLGLWYLDNYMRIDPNRLASAKVLYQFSLLTLCVMLFQVPYMGAVIAREKMNFFALVSIVDIFLKLFIVLLLPHIQCDKLIAYGAFLFAISIINLLMYIVYCTIYFDEMRLSLRVNYSLIRSLLSFSLWNFIGSFAFVFKNQGVNLLLNFFFGTVVNAARSIAYQINAALSSFSSSIFTAFNPQIVNSYASGNRKESINMMFIESKICFALILMLVIPIILELNLLLEIWLGDTIPLNTSLFATLVLIDSLIAPFNTPCTHIVYASGKIRLYQIGSTIINLLLVPACFFLLSYGLQAYWAFILTIIFSSINQIVCVINANKVVNFGLNKYIKQVLIPSAKVLLIVPVIPIFITIIMPDSFFRLLAVFISSIFMTLASAYYILLTDVQRNMVINKLLSSVLSFKQRM